MSAEPSAGYGANRWNDLIAAADQAASAAGDVDEDRTPVSWHSTMGIIIDPVSLTLAIDASVSRFHPARLHATIFRTPGSHLQLPGVASTTSFDSAVK